MTKIFKLLNKKSSHVFILCWIAYASIYFGRVNISVAIPAIESNLGISKSSIGIVGSFFFWTYGFGQLINGQIGDIVSTKKLIFVGLLFSGIANIIFGLTTSITIMTISWILNAFSQSMLWGPILRSLSNWFPQRLKSRIAMGISTSMVGGYMMAWGLSGKVISHFTWNYAFILPGVFLVLYSFIWKALFTKDFSNQEKDEPDYEEYHEFIENNKNVTLRYLFFNKKLSLIVLACFAQGVLKEGIALWAPVMFMETWNLDLKTMTQFILYIPLMNFMGIVMAGIINEKLGLKEKKSTIILFAIGVVMLGLFMTIGQFNIILSIIFLGLTSSMMFGVNTLLLGVVPMNYAKYNKASSVAGFLDFSSYMAAGLIAGVTGIIVKNYGWIGILVVWGVFIFAGIFAMILSIRYDKISLENNQIQ